jgi:hypothetical protein
MIPYEQLVSALTSWRQRNGLPTAAADVFGDSPALPLGDLAAPASQPEREEVVEMADDAIMAEEDSAMYEDAGSLDAGDYTAVQSYDDGAAPADDTSDDPR